MQTLPEIHNSQHLLAINKVKNLEKAVKEAFKSGELVNLLDYIPIKHTFIDGAYHREAHIPAGCVMIGKTHLKDCFNFLTKGRMLIIADGDVMEISAPYTFVTKAGTKKAGYTLEDSIFSNIFVTNETNIDKVEEEIAYDDSLELIGN